MDKDHAPCGTDSETAGDLIGGERAYSPVELNPVGAKDHGDAVVGTWR
jgi:hypothetical protein